MDKKTKNFLFFSLDLLGYKKGITALNIFCNTIIFGRTAAISFCVRQVLNIIESSQGFAFGLAVPYLVGIFIVILIRIAAIMGCAILDALRSYYYQNRIRMNVLNRLLKKDNINQVAGHSGPVFEVLSNDIPIATFPAELFTEVSGFFIYTLVALSMLLSINWQLTLFIFIPLSLAIYAIQRLSEAMKEKRHANRAAHDEASGFVADVIDAALAIKASGAEEPVLRRYDKVNKNRRTAILKDSLLNARIDVLLKGAVHVGSAIMMLSAAHLMAGDSFGLGDFSLFIAYMGTLADCVSRIVELIAESRKAEVSYERILNISGTEIDLNADAEITLSRYTEFAQPEYTKKRLKSFEVRGLSFDYGDGKGFQDVSFKVGPGELVVISGKVGSGKSTLVSVLMGLLPLGSGEILLDGRPLMANNREPVGIAGSTSGGAFFSRDLKENLCLGFPASQNDMLRSLSLAALDEMADIEKLSLDLGNRGSRLSGGQQQRLSLARMFLRGAELNIIDDCVSALDEDTRIKVLHRLIEYLKATGHSAIIATNEDEFLKAADQILFMEQHIVGFASD